ncbi:MAG: ABC transporter permease [Candidatus Pacebacteria bacterium]|nr:ABC transporter permease [Candidatus Paceibacterota bacterium]
MSVNWIGLYTFVRREVTRFLRVSVQTLVSPWISATLFIFVFGKVIGGNIGNIAGVSYIEFVLPGVLMMNMLTSAFSHSSSSLYFQRFARHIEEILVAPLSYAEMIIGYLSGAIIRGTIIGLGILMIGLFFGVTHIEHPFIFIFYILGVSTVFGLLGLLVGLWADGFEQLAVLTTFIITPLSFLGGMFNSLSMLPPLMQTLTRANPFFYFNDGLRYAMTGQHETSLVVGAVIILTLLAVSFTLVFVLFSRGWRLRA